MPKNNGNLALKGLDELLFSTEEQRQEEKREQVQQIPIYHREHFEKTRVFGAHHQFQDPQAL